MRTKQSEGGKLKIVSDGTSYGTKFYLVSKDHLGARYDMINDIESFKIEGDAYNITVTLKVSNVELELLTEKWRIE